MMASRQIQRRPIRVLPPDLSNLIAAGEVVERPASVVKELVENSLDAGAQRIRIELTAAGSKRIVVQDDGMGMTRQDALLALRRHATSKIASPADLRALSTLGFRGEALTSIAAVSRLELITRPPDEPLATRLLAEGGEVVATEQLGAPPGTRVTVSDLFFNTPARLRQLRKPATELAVISELVQGLALGHPNVAFTLSHERRRLMQTPGDGNLLSVAVAVFGAETVRQLLPPLHFDNDYLSIELIAGQPSIARASRQLQFFIVNGRPVQSDLLRRAVEREYQDLLPMHRYPVVIVKLALDPREIDVNIHPSKRTIRFVRPDVVAAAVSEAVRRSLFPHELAPRIQLGRTQSPRVQTGYMALQPLNHRREQLPPTKLPIPQNRPNDPNDLLTREQTATYRGSFSELRFLGVIDRTYIVAERSDGLVLIDQHAAHERVVFERLLRIGDASPLPTQSLSVPIMIELDATGLQIWEQYKDQMALHGFVGELFGERTILLREVPVLYRGEADAGIFRDLLDAMAATEGDPRRMEVDLAQRTMAACKAAIKAHDAISEVEIKALLAEMDKCRNPYTCPHGRPTLLVMTRTELERHFKRTGW